MYADDGVDDVDNKFGVNNGDDDGTAGHSVGDEDDWMAHTDDSAAGDNPTCGSKYGLWQGAAPKGEPPIAPRVTDGDSTTAPKHNCGITLLNEMNPPAKTGKQIKNIIIVSQTIYLFAPAFLIGQFLTD